MISERENLDGVLYNTPRMKVLISGIRVKLARGENLEDILAGYVKLTEEEKEYIRESFNYSESLDKAKSTKTIGSRIKALFGGV